MVEVVSMAARKPRRLSPLDQELADVRRAMWEPARMALSMDERSAMWLWRKVVSQSYEGSYGAFMNLMNGVNTTPKFLWLLVCDIMQHPEWVLLHAEMRRKEGEIRERYGAE